MPAVVPAIDGVRQVIRARLRSEKVECKTAIIRQVLPEIEAATNAGFTYVQIARWLAEGQDFAISGKHLSTIVSQLRKQKKGSREKTSTQLNMFEQLRAATRTDLRKSFKHDPVADAKELM